MVFVVDDQNVLKAVVVVVPPQALKLKRMGPPIPEEALMSVKVKFRFSKAHCCLRRQTEAG